MDYNYSWNRFSEVVPFLNGIYYNTVSWLKDNDYDIAIATELIHDIEDFIMYLGSRGYNVLAIVDKLREIDHIEFFDSLYTSNKEENNKKDLPLLINARTRILLNSEISSDNRLSSKERRRLYLYKGLAKNIYSLQTKNTLIFSKIYSNLLGRNSYKTELIVNNGWLVLEDALAQELAEKATYNILERVRPGLRPGLENDKINIGGHLVSSNLENERPFQSVLAEFGMTLSKIGNMYDYSENTIIESLLKYGIGSSISDIAIYEYIENGNTFELFKLLYYMGILQNEKLKPYHMSFIHKLDLSEEELNEIYKSIFEETKDLVNFNDKEYHPVDIIQSDNKETKNKLLQLIKEYNI